MLKKRYLPHTVSSTLLWRRALQEQEANKPWQSLKNRLLLWLQLLIAIAIVFALMEPVVQRLIAKDDHLIVVLDTSYSMHATTTDSGDSIFEETKQGLKKWLKDETSGSQITLITNGEYPQIVTSHETELNQVLTAIDQVEPYFGISDDQTTVSLARSLASHDEHAMVYYYVDNRFKSLDVAQQSPQFAEYWNVEETDEGNSSVRNLTMQLKSESSVEALVTIAHPSLQNGEFQLTISSYTKDNELLGKNEKSVSSLEGVYTTTTVNGLPIADYYKAELLPSASERNVMDNVKYGLLEQQAITEALLVSEGNLFLEKALQLMNVKVTKQSPNGEPPSVEGMEQIQFIIIDGSYDQLLLSESWNSFLPKYPLWIIDQTQSSDSTTVTPSQMKLSIEEHAITAFLSFQDTYISRLRELTGAEKAFGKAIVAYDGFPAIVAGYEGQMPRLRYTFSLADTDLPLRAEFPILIMQSIQYMSAGAGQSLGSFLVGEQPTVTYAPSTATVYWKAVASQFSNENSKPIKVEEKLVMPKTPGIYALMEQNEQGETVQSRTAIVDGDTYDFTAQLDTTQLAQINESIHAQESATSYGWQSILPLFAIFILLVLLAEWEVYRRGL